MATPPTPPSTVLPGAPPPKKQNILVWILGGCGTVLVLLVIVGGLAFRSFMKNNIRIGPDGSVDMKFGPMNIHGGKPQDVGLPVYPGVETAGAMGMEMTLPTARYGTQVISQAIYNSKDPVEKVDDWYHENLSAEFIRLDAGKNQTVLGDKAFPMPLDFGAISYSSKHGATRYAVTIHAIMGTTQIKLMRANAPPSKAQ